MLWELNPSGCPLMGGEAFGAEQRVGKLPALSGLETEEVVSKIWLPLPLPVVCLPNTTHGAVSGKPINSWPAPCWAQGSDAAPGSLGKMINGCSEPGRGVGGYTDHRRRKAASKLTEIKIKYPYPDQPLCCCLHQIQLLALHKRP